MNSPENFQSVNLFRLGVLVGHIMPNLLGKLNEDLARYTDGRVFRQVFRSAVSRQQVIAFVRFYATSNIMG